MTASRLARTILAVDDSPSIRRMVQVTLAGAGYKVIEAVDGQDALEKAGAHHAQLVITDQNMPRMDGLTLIRALRETPRYLGVPILVLTTESSDGIKATGRAAGATGWLMKPFDPARLIEVVRRFMT